MRGGEVRSGSLFSYVHLEARVPRSHPLRTIRAIVDAALARLDGDFAAIYAPIGRPSIPPEQLLRGLLLQAFYGVRSERQLMEQLDYNLLFRWFVGLGIDDPVWDVTVFTENRDRLLGGEIAQVLRCRSRRCARRGPAFLRALLRRRHADPGVGEPEELSAEGRLGRAAGSRAQRRTRLQGREALPHPLAEARGKNRMIEAAAAAARRKTMSLHIREAHTTIRSQRSLCGNPKTRHPGHKIGSQRLFPQPAS